MRRSSHHRHRCLLRHQASRLPHFVIAPPPGGHSVSQMNRYVPDGNPGVVALFACFD